MIFSSPEFLFVFLPIVLAVFALSRRFATIGVAMGALALASVVFYGFWRPQYIPILLGSVVWNFVTARGVRAGDRPNNPVLFVSVAGNLLLLFWFKYAAFGSSVLVDLGVMHTPLADKVLPLGISFFTFQQITYIIDRSRGIAPLTSFTRYLLFVSFFPQFIAGPIVHHAQMMPQFDRAALSWSGASVGLFVFAIGLCKKAVLADSLGLLADEGFADPAALPLLNAWLVTAAYTFQLYFDFSGYSDMAVGLGLLFGIQLPWNFLSPYKCTNIAAFWRRWHVTLSVFLRDYLYIPLGGSRCGRARTAVNLTVTMLLGGIWHGAGWTFMLWGLVHGAALAGYHLVRDRLPVFPGRAAVGWVVTMSIVVAGWVLFRAASFADAAAMYRALAGASGQLVSLGYTTVDALPYLLVAAPIALLAPNARQWAERYRPTVAYALFAGCLMALGVAYMIGRVESPEFLYFDF